MVERLIGYDKHKIPVAGESRYPHSHPYGEAMLPDSGAEVILKYRGTDGMVHIETTEPGGYTWIGGGIFHTIKFVGGGGIIYRPGNWENYPHEERDHL